MLYIYTSVNRTTTGVTINIGKNCTYQYNNCNTYSNLCIMLKIYLSVGPMYRKKNKYQCYKSNSLTSVTKVVSNSLVSYSQRLHSSQRMVELPSAEVSIEMYFVCIRLLVKSLCGWYLSVIGSKI